MSSEKNLLVIVPRSGYACTSVGVRMYLGRGTHVSRSGYDDNRAFLMKQHSLLDARNSRIKKQRQWFYGYKETDIHLSLGLVTTKEDECQHVTGKKVFSVCLPFSFSAYFCFSLINSVSWLSVRWAAAMRPFFITMLSGTPVRPRRVKKGLSTILPSQTT